MLNGLLWSSSDSHRRTQYPLVLIAETHRRHELDLVRQIQQALLQTKRRCVEATEQTAVARAVLELRASLQRFSPRQPAEMIGVQLSPTFQPGADELARVLHELRGSCSHLSSSRWSATASSDGASLVRVRLSTNNPMDLLDWMAVVSTQVHPAVSLLGFAERSAGIGDLLLGTPTAQNFFCLRASPRSLPFTTDIPFEIASGLREYASNLIHGIKQGQRPARSVFGDTVTPNISRIAPLPLTRS
jgi:hypothetical protein